MRRFRWRAADLVPLTALAAAAGWGLLGKPGTSVAQPHVTSPPPAPVSLNASTARALADRARDLQPSAHKQRTPGAGLALKKIPAPPPVPKVALLVTDDAELVVDLRQSVETHLIIKDADADNPEQTATLEHPATSVVKGTMIRGTHKAAVVADLDATEDRSWSGSLVVLDPNAGAARQRDVKLRGGVYLGAAPVVLDDGRMIVQTGDPGGEPTDDDIEQLHMRVDKLRIDEVPQTASPRTLRRYEGYIAHVAGAIEHRVFVYLVQPRGAKIIVLDADRLDDSGDLKRDVPPFASDFTVNRKNQSLLFTNRTAQGTDFTINEIDLGGNVRELSRSDVPVVPGAWTNGGVAQTKADGTIEQLHDDTNRSQPSAPRALSVEKVNAGVRLTLFRSLSADQKWAVGWQDGATARAPVLVYAGQLAGQAERPALGVKIPAATRVQMMEVIE